jgi:hypothetical protein
MACFWPLAARYFEPCTILYCTILYCTVLYCTVLYCTVLYCTVLYCTILYCTILYCTVLYCTVLYCTVLYCTVLYCTVPGLEVEKNMVCQSKNFLAGEINFSLQFLFIELPNLTVKINVFMICIFTIFKLVYFTTVNLDLHFKYKRI